MKTRLGLLVLALMLGGCVSQGVEKSAPKGEDMAKFSWVVAGSAPAPSVAPFHWLSAGASQNFNTGKHIGGQGQNFNPPTE